MGLKDLLKKDLLKRLDQVDGAINDKLRQMIAVEKEIEDATKR